MLCRYDRSKKGYTFPLYLLKSYKKYSATRFYKTACKGKLIQNKRKVSVLFAARPRTGGTQPAGRHRPFTCQHWRSKDCNLKRAAPSDVWGNLCIIKVMAGKSRWLMGFPLDRCGIAPAIAAILAPTSLALFPWNVPIVLDIQFSRSRKYFLLYTPNVKFSALALRKIWAFSMNQRLCSRRRSRLRSFWREKSRILSFLARSMVL